MGHVPHRIKYGIVYKVEGQRLRTLRVPEWDIPFKRREGWRVLITESDLSTSPRSGPDGYSDQDDGA